MSSEERQFERILATLGKKEKQAQTRASVLTVLTLGVGLLLMAILSYQIVTLRRTRTSLERDVTELQTKKTAASEELVKINTELVTAKQQLDKASKDFGAIVKNIKAGNKNEALKIASKGVTNPPTGPPGFIANDLFQGPDKTTISVEVIPEPALLNSRNRPRSFTYELAGKNYFNPPPQNTITFTLDKTTGTRIELNLFLDFVSGESGGYLIKENASAGISRHRAFRVGPPRTGASRTINLVFTIM
ncbi:MAG: hypothetical protein QOH41_207 [Blastocatellia bacterium]|jgi:hypothetical protein|nr:hypothetical protein [Blastocatellia bacterium]